MVERKPKTPGRIVGRVLSDQSGQFGQITGFCNDTNARADSEAVRFVRTLPPWTDSRLEDHTKLRPFNGATALESFGNGLPCASS
jgi:hypothetical protein